MVVSQPSLLNLGVDETLAPTLDWLQRRLGLDAAQLRKMVLRLPPLLGYSVEDTMEPKLDWLQRRLDLDAAQLKKVVVPFPALLGYRVEDNLAPKLDWLQTRLDLDDAQLKKMILTSQSLLGYSVDDNMKPTLGWLRTRLELSDAALKRMVLALPPLLGLSVVDNVAPTLAWLQRRLDLGDAGLRKVVVAYPTLLGLRIERMESNCAWLERRLGLDEKQLARVVVASPPLLYLSVDGNLAPKLDYLLGATGLSSSEFRDHIIRIPAIPSYSLDKRYRPRVEACRAAGVDAAYVLTAAPLTDEYFYERLETMREVVVATASSRATPLGRRAFSTASSDDGNGLPGTEHGGRRLAIVFTCTVCDTRSAKKFSEHAYRHGVVVVRCPGCGNDHLIADNLGFFEDDWTLEDMLRARGDSVETLDDDNLAEGVDAELLKRLVEGRRGK